MSLRQQPGFRRRFLVKPESGRVRCQVEDDFHSMEVCVEHDNDVATLVTARMIRAPWNTCPGAEAVVAETFKGVPLADFAKLRGKQRNCTHLFDLALLAGAHALDSLPLDIEILVSDDDSQGICEAELWSDKELLLSWRVQGFTVLEPASAQGTTLDKLTPWINQQPQDLQESARLLRWAIMVSHGRRIPMSEQSDATKMAPSCYTFQPERAVNAKRIGQIYDFSRGGRQPLEPVQP